MSEKAVLWEIKIELRIIYWRGTEVVVTGPTRNRLSA